MENHIHHSIKEDLITSLGGDYDPEERWAEKTVQGGHCKYNEVLTKIRIDQGLPIDDGSDGNDGGLLP